MKYILMLMMSFSVYAVEIKDFNRTDISAEKIFDMIWAEAYEFYTGDDGEECNADAFAFIYTPGLIQENFSINFTANQNGEARYGCIVGDFPCKAGFYQEKGKWKLNATCDYSMTM